MVVGHAAVQQLLDLLCHLEKLYTAAQIILNCESPKSLTVAGLRFLALKSFPDLLKTLLTT